MGFIDQLSIQIYVFISLGAWWQFGNVDQFCTMSNHEIRVDGCLIRKVENMESCGVTGLLSCVPFFLDSCGWWISVEW